MSIKFEDLPTAEVLEGDEHMMVVKGVAYKHPLSLLKSWILNNFPQWSQVLNKPATFPPAAHSQAWTTITSKPTEFQPVQHGHPQEEIDGLVPRLEAIEAGGGGGAVTWENVTNKPTTFPPETHIHAQADITDLISRLEALEAGGASLPSGLIAAWWTDTPPTGWVLADGHATTNEPTLVAIFGANVPNFNTGKFLMGAGGIYTLNSTGGAATVTLTVDQMPSHNHSTTYSYAYGTPADWVFLGGQGSQPQKYQPYTGNTGGGQAHENLPPYVAINWIIKL